jgi:hypothetical protein
MSPLYLVWRQAPRTRTHEGVFLWVVRLPVDGYLLDAARFCQTPISVRWLT